MPLMPQFSQRFSSTSILSTRMQARAENWVSVAKLRHVAWLQPAGPSRRAGHSFLIPQDFIGGRTVLISTTSLLTAAPYLFHPLRMLSVLIPSPTVPPTSPLDSEQRTLGRPPP